MILNVSIIYAKNTSKKYLEYFKKTAFGKLPNQTLNLSIVQNILVFEYFTRP